METDWSGHTGRFSPMIICVLSDDVLFEAGLLQVMRLSKSLSGRFGSGEVSVQFVVQFDRLQVGTR